MVLGEPPYEAEWQRHTPTTICHARPGSRVPCPHPTTRSKVTTTGSAGGSANEEQERFRNDVAGPLWVEAEEEIERHTGPFGDVALAAAA